MKKTMMKRILSLVLSVALVFGTISYIGEWKVKAAEIPEITMQLTGAPTAVKDWYFERTELPAEYEGTGWSDTRRYRVEAFKDGSSTPNEMWIEFIDYRTYIYGGVNFVDGVVPTSSFHIPANTEFEECTRSDADGSLTLVSGGHKVRLTHDLTIMKVDGVWIQKPVSDGTDTEPTLMSGSYDSSNKAYALNIWSPNMAKLETIGTVEGTIQVNGVNTTAKWIGTNNPGYYQLLVPCSAFPYGGASSTNANLQGSAYVTVSAGTTIGSLTFEEDMYVKINCDTMADGDYMIEQVDSLPKDGYFFASWNYNSTEFRIQFRPVTAHTDTVNTSPTRTIYINGVAKTFNCYDDLPYQFRVPHTALGGTAYDNHATNIVRVPAMTLGDMTLTEDVWLKIAQGVREELIPTTFSASEGSTYDDTNKQYVIKFKPDDTRKVWTPGISTMDLSIDGKSVAAAVASWSNEADCFVARVPYSAIDANATSASKIGSHLVTLPKGSYVGNRLLEEDVTVAINGTTVSSVVKASLGTGNGYQDNNKRYVVWVVPSDGIIDTSIIGRSVTIYVDDEKKSASWTWYGTSSYALAVPYSSLKTGAESYSQVGKHMVKLPAGTDLGGRMTGNDLYFRIDGENVTECVPMDFSILGNGNASNFVIFFTPTDGRTPVTPVNPDRTLWIDGKKVENAVDRWYVDAGIYKMVLKFNVIQSGATHYNQLSPHCVVVPKGTVVGDTFFSEDVYFKAYNSYAPVVITDKFTMEYASSAVETEGYRISLDVNGIADATALAGASPILYVEGTETKDATISYVAKDADTLDLILPYNVVKSGAKSAADITQPYVITIPSHILFNNAALTESISFVVNGSKVTGVLESSMTVSLSAHSSNGTSGPTTLKFTTSPSDFLSAGASYEFLTGGIAVDGVTNTALAVKKEADGVYSIDLSGANVQNGTVVAISGTVQDGTSGVVFTRKCFRYRTNGGWTVYDEPTVTNVSLSNDTINGALNLQGICMNATSDPLANGNYQQSGFVFEDTDGEVRRHGGICVNGEYPDSIQLTKKWDGYWFIDLSGMIGNLESGSIITLSGTLCVGNNHVVFSEISYMYNKDGSFSQCESEVELAPNKTVTLPDVWVNINKYQGFDIQSAPLQQGASVELKVDGKTTTESMLQTVGNYEVTRVVENAVKAEVVGGQPEYLVYEQNVHLYETGDANGDGKTGAKDIVYQMKHAGQKENVMKSGSDLNGDGVMNEVDFAILKNLVVGKTAVVDVLEACKDISIGAISDTHYMANGRDGQNRINTIKALNYYKSQNVDVILLNGDITDYGEVTAYQELVADIKLVYPNEETRPTMIFTGDNHEWYDVWTVNGHTPIPGETFYTLQDRFNNELSELRDGLKDSNSHYVVDGYHILGVSSDGMNGGYSTYDEDTLTWLDETLDAAVAEDATKPIFLGLHQAPINTVVGSEDSHYDSADMDAILAKYPQLVIITSHTHASVQDERSIFQGAYTVLNTASTYYVGSVKGSLDNSGLMSEKYQFAQGLLIRANNATVDIERCDFYNDVKIKDNWSFTAGDNTVYTTERAQQSGVVNFATNAAWDVEWKDSTTIQLSFDAATDKQGAVAYTVEAYLDGYTSPVKTKTISSLYWLGEEAIQDTYTVEIEGLAKNKNYEFYITASNCWGVSGKPLVAYYDGMDTEGHGPIDINELLTLNHGIELRTDENGDFKVLVISDPQSNSAVLEEDIQENIRILVDREEPDLVVFGGDNSYGMDTPEKLRSYLDSMVGYIEEKQIPWAHVYGNHDDQNEGDLVAMSNEEQQPIYEEYEYCISKAGDPGVFGVGNYVIPVMNHDNDKLAFAVWGLDTGSYLEEKVPDLVANGNRYYGHYEYIQRSQINWYNDVSEALKEYNDGEAVPGMMYFHIPLMENALAWSIKESEGLEYSGQVYNGMASAAVNKGLFSKVVERGEVKVIVSAHDHLNDYMVKYQGVRLCASSTVTTVNEFDPTMMGGRVVTYSASAEEQVQTRMSYLYSELNIPTATNTTKVNITGVDTGKTSMGATNNIYLKTDVTGAIGSTFKDIKAQVHHYIPSTETGYGIKTDIGWTAQGELRLQSKASIANGDEIILPKGMIFEIGGVTYELASTYRLTSNGSSLSGAVGADPVKIQLNGFNGWNKNMCSYYLTSNYNYTGKTWKMFFDNGANIYYGPTPVATGVSWVSNGQLYVQNGCAHILDGTVVTVPKGFRFTICGVLYEVEKTAQFICENGNLKMQ